MKLTKSRLRQIIKEELERNQLAELDAEAVPGDEPTGTEASAPGSGADLSKFLMDLAPKIRAATFTPEEVGNLAQIIQALVSFADGSGDLSSTSTAMTKLTPGLAAMSKAAKPVGP